MARLFTILCLFATALAQCKYETVTANCFCSDEVDIREKVVFVQIQSESCRCVVKLVDFHEPPRIYHSFDSNCTWTCTNQICVPKMKAGLEWNVDKKKETTTEPGKTMTETKKLPVEIKTTISAPINGNQGLNHTIKTTITGFWIWFGVLTLFFVLGLLKQFHQSMTQRQQFQYAHPPSEATQISQTQTSFASMTASMERSIPLTPQHSSTPEVSPNRFLSSLSSSEARSDRTVLPMALFPPHSSTPEVSLSRFLPFTSSSSNSKESTPERAIIGTHDSSPEPSAPPMELVEVKVETPSPVASRTRHQKKKTAEEAL